MERYTLVKGLDDLANGNNKKRLVFEQYVLISCFEEILYAANLRLQTMSAGRYELRRVRGIVDARSKDNLEMEVLDWSHSLVNIIEEVGNVVFWAVVAFFGIWVFSKFVLNLGKLRGEA